MNEMKREFHILKRPGLTAAAILFLSSFSLPEAGGTMARETEARPKNTLAVMVYFRDKGFRSQEDIESALKDRAGQISPRAMARRAKVGRARLNESDLPVCQDYVQSLERLGAKLRHTLRWLNAASFQMTEDQLDSCRRLFFVERIEPLKRRLRKIQEPEFQTEDRISLGGQGRLLNYGPSYRQNQMINAVVAHDSGYSGAGVWVAMLDNGFRKNHQAFAQIISSGRLVDEWDFVSNSDTVDWSSHGTATWSVAGGYAPGQLIGPAYGASWAIYHTEDNSQEMPIEEDHWAAALERADSIGADIVSSSLGYRDFDSSQYSYTYSQLNGQTAISTIAAKHAAALGIIVCNAMGNDGPDLGTLLAPADADSIISVGATDSLGFIASYSSRGPTYDLRPKPEVCAQGSSTVLANWYNVNAYGRGSGTSFATPLVAGACALVLEAHPEWTPHKVREALMMTAGFASNPDSNTYGWGVIDVWAAMHYDQSGVSRPGADQERRLSLSVFPNPFSYQIEISYHYPLSGQAGLWIYDAQGRLVYHSPKPQARGRFCWDGRDLSGNRARSGLYFFKIEEAERTGLARALLIR